jgi:hypothetical protein
MGVGEICDHRRRVAHEPKSPGEYRAPLREHEELAHLTIEVQRCDDTQHAESATSTSGRNPCSGEKAPDSRDFPAC